MPQISLLIWAPPSAPASGAGSGNRLPQAREFPGLMLPHCPWGGVCPQAQGRGVRGAHGGSGGGENRETSAEGQESPHSPSELLWAKKTRSLNPLKHSSELGKATTGIAGRACPLQTWLLLPQETISVGWEMFSACLSASSIRGRLEPGACRAWQGRAELPPAPAPATQGNTGSGGKERGNGRTSLGQGVTKVQSIRLGNEPLGPLEAGTAAVLQPRANGSRRTGAPCASDRAGPDVAGGTEPVPAPPGQDALSWHCRAPPGRGRAGDGGAGAGLEAR